MTRQRPGRRKARALATYLIDLSPDDMKRRLPEALRVYVDAMRYPRGTEEQRAALWLEHTRRAGWKCVAAVDVAGAGAESCTGAPTAPATADLVDAPCRESPTATAERRTSGGNSRSSPACSG